MPVATGGCGGVGSDAVGRTCRLHSEPDAFRRGDVGDRGSHRRGQPRPQRRHVTRAVRVDPVREKDDEGPGGGVDPERGSREAGVAV